MNFILPKSNALFGILILIDLSVTANTANYLIHIFFKPYHLSFPPSSLVRLSLFYFFFVDSLFPDLGPGNDLGVIPWILFFFYLYSFHW